jgi:hypothetical protein
LSCREADWFGAIDTQRLNAVSPQGEIAVLQLEPLERDDVKALLGRWSHWVSDADQFMHEAEQRQLMPLLKNPLLLELMVAAVQGTQWPAGRNETYELACQHLASEHNPFHRRARRAKPIKVNNLLDDAGLLCAVSLLAAREGFTDNASPDTGREIPVDSLPAALGVQDAAAVFASKVFSGEGGLYSPRHRTIAEYLAARAIAGRVMQGELPISRVLALMSIDGGIVEPLRGLNAWLAVHCLPERRLLIDLDPLGVVLYGDVRSFSVPEKRRVLDGLYREAQQFRWFRNGDSESHQFGALGTRDMTATLQESLAKPDRSPAHQSLLDCVLDAIRYGDDMPELATALEVVVRDPSIRDGVRGAALEAWFRQIGPDLATAVGWLSEVRAGTIQDSNDELCGALLNRLYPDFVPPERVMAFLHPSKAPSLFGTYRNFWTTEFLERTPAQSLPLLADALVVQAETWESVRGAYERHYFIGEFLLRALEAAGKTEPVDRVHRWLGVGLDEHDSVFLGEAGSKKIRDWLTRHPQTQKDLFSYAIARMSADALAAASSLYRAEQRLYGADRPRDWCRWLLEQAAKTDVEMVARDCLIQAALAAINSSPRYDISIEDVERWLAQHRRRWPIGDDDGDYDPWLRDIWWLPLDHWQGRERHRSLNQEAKSRAAKASHRAEVLQNMASIKTGGAAPGWMLQIALAYREQLADIVGDGPEERVQNFLVGSAEEAQAAIEGIKHTIERTDLPSVDDILRLHLEQRYHWIRPACLLAAELIHRERPDAAMQWSDSLARQMVAFRLTDGTGNTPAWYLLLAEQRPQIVAELMEAYVRARIRKYADQNITGLFELAREDAYRQVSRLMLPGVLRSFPHRANDAQRFVLNRSLLPAALRHLERMTFKEIVDSRLALKSLDAGQRIAWLVASLQFDADRRSRELVDFIGRSQSRAADLGHALDNQSDRGADWSRLPVEVLARLIEMLGPQAVPEFRTGVGTVTDADRRRDLVRPFIQQLAGSPDSLAGEELKRLRALPVLKHWSIAFDAAQHEHVRVARAARFAHATAEEVAHTLANQSPANALDLAALVIDQLRIIERKLHGDETNGLYLFRRDDKVTPKVEPDCRDVLLDKLREPLLKHQVQLEREASAAHDKRADIRPTATVRGRRVVVPVEVKKDDYKGDREKRWSLWTAWREQLDKLYVIDPAAQGVGIYLVLWFGMKPLATPEGVLPVIASDLQRLLVERIPPEERGRLQVVVLDLSFPQH